jgi:RNA recognition motif-containing protein
MRDRVTGDPRGFAFVVFQEGTAVDLVMNEPKHEINHKVVDVKRAQARGIAPPSIHRKEDEEQQPDAASQNNSGVGRDNNNPTNGATKGPTPEQMGNKVFVGGIPPNIDRDGLKEIFSRFGTVVDGIVMMDQTTNRSRCFGFVTFEVGCNGAQLAIEAQPLDVQGRHVEVKLATPKTEQRRQPQTAGPRHVGLRAGISTSSSSSEYSGLAVSYGRSGWKAGYGSYAFGKAGWGVAGWEDFGNVPDRSGFSFKMLKNNNVESAGGSSQPPTKRARH